MKVWAKLILDERVHKSAVNTCAPFSYVKDFHECAALLCNELDIPTPVILTKHITHFIRFHNCSFLPSDFIEQVSFEKLIFEDITE